ncbi:hypothetical protein NIES2119_29490 [[Phormidium ambiguum] IAM M-71]|uniref:Uncharacterized protein n=1 Tax=[Phormidium ambiguum] IAM M-71 TaxID=454136 RepID=A0A1U7I4I3_9CYAN|nr:hypothetical protein [Phormidium ambiguum]OKH31106.1 hypothetical protein NIES2119_29490 [Phormidium ambiguum IAM M-71]
MKESQDLLTILSQQAQSGSSDLIRWSAATTIDNLGFDFITVSQYLSEEPKKIAEKIVQSKVKRFADQNLVNSNDYDEFVRFWLYGNYQKLREVTLGIEFWDLYEIWRKTQETPGYKDEKFNKFDVCWKLVNSLGLKGIKDINAALERAEAMGDNASELDENEFFEGIGQTLATINGENYGIKTKLLCLQSNNSKTRYVIATTNLKSEGGILLDNLKQSNPTLALALITFANPSFSINYPYEQLTGLAENLKLLERSLRRKKVRQDCQIWYDLILEELDKRRKTFEVRKNQSIALREKLDRQLNQIRDINRELWEQVFARVSFDNPPQLSVENEQYSQIFDMYEKSLKEKLASLREPVSNFYDSFISNELLPIEAQIKATEKTKEVVNFSLAFAPLTTVILTGIYLWVIGVNFVLAIIGGFIIGAILGGIIGEEGRSEGLGISKQIMDYWKLQLQEYNTICYRKKSEIETQKNKSLNLLNI